MEYRVKELADMAGGSTRTLRYYDEIGILKPVRKNPSGYRIYGPEEVDRLQQILFYRELGVDLKRIKDILCSPDFDEIKVLKEHLEKLLEMRENLDLLIKNVNKTILSKERKIKMNDSEKFEGFKKKLIEDNEKKYGKEIREKYGVETVDKSNKKLKNMTQEEYEKITRIEEEMIETFHEALQAGDTASELAQKAADLSSSTYICATPA